MFSSFSFSKLVSEDLSALKMVNSAIHKSRRPHGSRPFHDLPGTIPLFHCSNREAVNGGTTSGGGSNRQLFWEWPVTKEVAAL